MKSLLNLVFFLMVTPKRTQLQQLAIDACNTKGTQHDGTRILEA